MIKKGALDVSDVVVDLKRDEGFVSHAYQDSGGYWTIGYGRMVDRRLGGGVSEFEAMCMLERDINKAISLLDAGLSWWRELPEPHQRGLINMAFNLGTRLMGFRKMLGALQARDWELAANEALDSKWAGQVKIRANRIADLFRNPPK